MRAYNRAVAFRDVDDAVQLGHAVMTRRQDAFYCFSWRYCCTNRYDFFRQDVFAWADGFVQEEFGGAPGFDYISIDCEDAECNTLARFRVSYEDDRIYHSFTGRSLWSAIASRAFRDFGATDCWIRFVEHGAPDDVTHIKPLEENEIARRDFVAVYYDRFAA